MMVYRCRAYAIRPYRRLAAQPRSGCNLNNPMLTISEANRLRGDSNISHAVTTAERLQIQIICILCDTPLQAVDVSYGEEAPKALNHA